MVDLNPNISINALNAIDLNVPVKKIVRVELQKQNSTICCLWVTNKYKDTKSLKVNGQNKNDIYTNINWKKAGRVILISKQVDFKAKSISRAQEDIS